MKFTKKELLSLMEDTHDNDLKHKIAKMLLLKPIDCVYTRYCDSNGKWSKKFATFNEAHDELEKKLGKWTLKNADKWNKYEFVDVNYGYEESYTY